MARYTRKDQHLLSEAYGVQLLKESFPKMTLQQMEKSLGTLTLSESEYVEQFSEKIINEFFGGLKALAGGAGKLAGNAASGLGKGLVNKAKQVGSGLAAAGKQVGSNVKDIYSTAEDQAKQGQDLKQAQSFAQQLVQLIQAAAQKGLAFANEDPMKMSLEDIVNELVLAQQGATNRSNSAQKRGVFGGAGKSFQKGYQG